LKCTGTRTKIYDVAATFLEDIQNNNLKVLEISEAEQNQFIKHFEGCSWRKFCDNKQIEELGIKTEKEYNEFIMKWNNQYENNTAILQQIS
jgi:hypothetical protein